MASSVISSSPFVCKSSKVLYHHHPSFLSSSFSISHCLSAVFEFLKVLFFVLISGRRIWGFLRFRNRRRFRFIDVRRNRFHGRSSRLWRRRRSGLQAPLDRYASLFLSLVACFSDFLISFLYMGFVGFFHFPGENWDDDDGEDPG